MNDAGLIFIGFPFLVVFLSSIMWLSHKLVGILPLNYIQQTKWEDRIFCLLFIIFWIGFAFLAKLIEG